MTEVSYSPAWCSHVSGKYNAREVDPETGESEPQIIRMECSRCGATHQVNCLSGAVKTWVNKFANVHFHSDPLDPKHIRRMAERAAAKRGG